MTIFLKGVLCNQSSVWPSFQAQMNNSTLNKGKIFSLQGLGTVSPLRSMVQLYLQLSQDDLSAVQTTSLFFITFLSGLPYFSSSCATAEAVFQTCHVIAESIPSTRASHHLFTSRWRLYSCFFQSGSCCGRYNDVVFGIKHQFFSSKHKRKLKDAKR